MPNKQQTYGDWFNELIKSIAALNAQKDQAVGNFNQGVNNAVVNQASNLWNYPGVIANTPTGQIPQWGGQNPASRPIIPQAQASTMSQQPNSSVRNASYGPTGNMAVANYPGQPVSQQGNRPSKNNTGYMTHVVQPGDTLWGIAQKYMGNGDNWHQLKGFNFHTDPRYLQIGTQIHVPIASMQQSQQASSVRMPQPQIRQGGIG